MNHLTTRLRSGYLPSVMLLGICASVLGSMPVQAEQVALKYRAFCSEYKKAEKHDLADELKYNKHCLLEPSARPDAQAVAPRAAVSPTPSTPSVAHDRSGKPKGNNGIGTTAKNDGGNPPGGGNTKNDTN